MAWGLNVLRYPKYSGKVSKSKGIPVTGHGGPQGLREVKAPTLLRQTANRWRQGCQPYAPAALYPQVSLFFTDSWYSFPLEAELIPGPVRPEGLDQFKKFTSSGLETATFQLAA
jgi:hypothetical protein